MIEVIDVVFESCVPEHERLGRWHGSSLLRKRCGEFPWPLSRRFEVCNQDLLGVVSPRHARSEQR